MERTKWSGKVFVWWMLEFSQLQVLDAVKNGHQAMVFVHSRKDTVKTGRILVRHSYRDGLGFLWRYIRGFPEIITFVVHIIISPWCKATFSFVDTCHPCGLICIQSFTGCICNQVDGTWWLVLEFVGGDCTTQWSTGDFYRCFWNTIVWNDEGTNCSLGHWTWWNMCLMYLGCYWICLL